MKYFSTKYLLVSIMLLAFFLRFYKLGQTPPSLMIDELSNGYNAYSILKTAKDEYGNFLPLTFKSFGDFNPALSVYALVPSIAVFGLNEFGVRFPSALLGSFTVLTTFFLVKKLTSNTKAAVLATFFLAISPWHLQFSRYDHEANFMLTLSLLGLALFLYALEKPKLLYLSAITFGLALNSYHGAKIWIPLFVTAIVLIYRTDLKKIKKVTLGGTLILIVSSFPILMNFENSLIRGQSVGILKSDKPVETLISGYLDHFSPVFLFFSGDSIGRHSVSGMGQLYVFELVLIIFGLVYLVQQKTKGYRLLTLWLILAPIPAALATPAPHALRSITFLPLFSIIAAFGLLEILKSKYRLLSRLSLFVLLAVAIYNFATYWHLYYLHEPKLKALDWSSGYKEMVQYISQNRNNYGSIAVSDYYGHPYIFILFYSKYDPSSYQTQSQNKRMFDKYEVFGQSWGKSKPGKALEVTPFWQAHPSKVLKEVYSNNGDLMFVISESE